MVSAANFFVYTLRFAVFDWGTTILKETKHVEVSAWGVDCWWGLNWRGGWAF